MSKFLVTKKISLDFLSDAWKEKDCYLEFNAFTIRDLQEKFPEIANNSKDPSLVQDGMNKTIDLLKEHFVSGKGLGTDGKVIDISAGDLVDLPAEVINRVFSFLSEPLAKAESQQ